jgi:CDP-diacylglycerol---glycerol-3-phosphate 3-phosphatidyltransferase
MFTLPNLLSLMRLPLAFVFLQANPYYRAMAIVLALITDGLDGYVARRYNLVNRIGTLLDPLMDKFFVFFALSVLIHEQSLSWKEACMLICRDFSVIIYGCYLALRGRLLSYRFRAIWCGKVTTVLQLLVLFGLTFHVPFPSYTYGIFILLGVLALVELYHTDRARRSIANN